MSHARRRQGCTREGFFICLVTSLVAELVANLEKKGDVWVSFATYTYIAHQTRNRKRHCMGLETKAKEGRYRLGLCASGRSLTFNVTAVRAYRAEGRRARRADRDYTTPGSRIMDAGMFSAFCWRGV